MSRFLCASSLLLSIALSAAPQPPQTQSKPPVASVKKAAEFKSFTGKVLGSKVRVRAKAEMDGHIIRQLSKNDLLLVVGEEGEFYAVQPPKETKAYVFRSYVIDSIVEANRVNVRLEPHVDSPIIGQLQAGDRVQGQVCPMNTKWFEIAPPANTRFYVSKEFVAKAGGPEFLAQTEKKRSELEEMLTSAYLSAESECKKSYEEISFEPVVEQFQAILQRFSEFPDAVSQAKEGLALFKTTYLNKKIQYLEDKSDLSPAAKEELIAKHRAEVGAEGGGDLSLWSRRLRKKEGKDCWSALEESLYISWTAFHCGKKTEDFYAEQKANASVLTGTVEPYTHDVKNRPGDFVLRSENSPVAYLYSTHVDLSRYAGKTVTVLASARPNNHFAFPAYYVLSIE